MKITTDAGIEIDESQIDVEYAKGMIQLMLDKVLSECVFAEDAHKELKRIEGYVEKAKARADLMADKCLATFEACGYTGEGVAAYLDSRKKHDPMDDDPNRDRNPQ